MRPVKRNTLSCQNFVAYIGVVGIAAKKEKHSGHVLATKYSYCKIFPYNTDIKKVWNEPVSRVFKLTTCRSVADSLTLQDNNSMIEKYII